MVSSLARWLAESLAERQRHCKRGEQKDDRKGENALQKSLESEVLESCVTTLEVVVYSGV